MPWATRVPDAIDALVQAFATAPELDGVLVMDGPAITSKATSKVLSVGWTPVEGETAVETTEASESLAGNPDLEQFTIRCTAAVLDGATDVRTVRVAAYDLLSAAGTVIDRNRQLDGAVMRAEIGAHSLMQEQTKQGAQALLAFEVNCGAFTRR